MPELPPSAWQGPRPEEGPPRRYGPVARVAVLSDVHGNVPALAAVLAEPDVATADLVVLCGDLTWGPEPEETYALIAGLGDRAVAVRGNADRCVVELAAGTRAARTPRETWMPDRHSREVLAFLRALPFSAIVDVAGLGDVLFCHGSPRSDNELVTSGTPADRFARLSTDVTPKVLATGHTHLQLDRTVGDRRSLNPGSVGLPFHLGEPGTAYWALLGPDVALRSTRYDPDAAVARTHASGDPAAERVAALLLGPPTPEEIVADAESRVFAD
jgi:putative phosphoesterase